MMEEATRENNKDNNKETIKEPTSTQEARDLITKLKDLSDYIEFFVSWLDN